LKLLQHANINVAEDPKFPELLFQFPVFPPLWLSALHFLLFASSGSMSQINWMPALRKWTVKNLDKSQKFDRGSRHSRYWWDILMHNGRLAEKRPFGPRN
jgi:hypothetical protein